MAAVAASLEEVSYLSQSDAAAVDAALMGPQLGFSLDSLMELAGLSVAAAVEEVYPRDRFGRVLVLAGPGNNGGDGLVAARHLRHFGYAPVVCLPRSKPLFAGLVKQLTSLDIPFLSAEEVLSGPLHARCDLVLDALFGFSFRGEPKPPFDALLAALCCEPGTPPVASIDIPSGWDVEAGDVGGGGIKPDLLVSLTAPKLGVKDFAGRHHFLGGRFVPPAIATRFSLRLPAFRGSQQCVRMPPPGRADADELRR